MYLCFLTDPFHDSMNPVESNITTLDFLSLTGSDRSSLI